MHRRGFLRAGALCCVAGVAGCGGSEGQTDFYEGFEDGADDWETAAHIGPEVDVDEFEWTIEPDTAEAASGQNSLRVTNEGDYDDGTCWAVHPVDISGDGPFEISVSAQFWSESESFNILRNAVMRLGPERPSTEADFPDPGQNTSALGETPYGGLREPLHLAEGWREYAFTWTTPELSTDRLYVALGTSVVWETEATHYIDDVRVEIEPR